MLIDDGVLSAEEKICLRLRSLYRKYGYSCFKMSKFEEYDLYGKNKDFLISDSVITFTDTNGKLMALKPDVTLSIIKNSPAETQGVSRLYYNENVYRISESTKRFKELMQVGLECIGNVTEKETGEAAELAALSLKEISSDSILVLSHLGILSAALAGVKTGAEEFAALLGEKNVHGVKELCVKTGADESTAALLTFLAQAYGEYGDIIARLKTFTAEKSALAAAEELEKVCARAENTGVKTRVDLSLSGDMNYYNGIVFKGYVNGVPTRILSGGQYDGLMAKMGKKDKAVGFAVYADLLERFNPNAGKECL